MKRKVAILTTHRANNFGAMLQAYSLVMACREFGADAEILDWRCPFFEWLYHRAWRIYRNPIPAIKHLLWYIGAERESRKLFNCFRSRFPISRPIFRQEELRGVNGEYDVFIAGSDQIWNPLNSAINPKDCDRTYLLDFVKSRKKYAYAASIGKKELSPPELVAEFVELWKSFDRITMREVAGSDYVGRCLNRKIETVVDPVLLHGYEYWRKVAVPKDTNGKYVLMYNIRRSSLLQMLAYRVAKERGLRVIDLLVPGQGEDGGAGKSKFAAGPSEFLYLIDGAECVFTGSFHASAFSLIFGKKLYVQFPLTRENTNSRMETLFSWAMLTGQNIVEDDCSRVIFYDCSKKNDEVLNNEIYRSRRVLSEMVC